MHEELDEKSRPLFLVRSNGQVMFFRYHDMPDSDKEKCIRFFSILEKKGLVLQDGEGKNIKDINVFLGFQKDHDVCG